MSKRCDKCEYWKNPSATTLYATCTCKDADECGVSTFMTHVCSLDPRSQLEKEKTDMEAEFEEIKQKACALIEGMRMYESLSDTISEITSTILAAAAKADHYNAVCERIKAE